MLKNCKKYLNFSFTKHNTEKKCDPTKLKELFERYFTTDTTIQDPIELANAFPFMEKLKNISIEGSKMAYQMQ